MNITTLFERLKTEWVPEFDTFDGRYRLCYRCLEKNAQPFRGECQSCYEQERDKTERRLQHRKRSGFTDFCIRCQQPYCDVYVTSHDSYIAERYSAEGYEDMYRVYIHGPCYCSLCTACVEYYATHPAYVADNYVAWQRNIRLIRKVAEGHMDRAMQEACSVISELEFE